MTQETNIHPESNPNTGSKAWKFIPRRLHTQSYPLNPHASFIPKYPLRGQIVWGKGQDHLSYERIWEMHNSFVYPETRVYIQEREIDGAFIVWVTSKDDNFRWASDSYTNLGYAKRQAMKFRYAIDPLAIALQAEPTQDYQLGERVQCCNGSMYPDLQLGYVMGTITDVNQGADMVTVEFDSHSPKLRHVRPMRIDHIYSIESKTFSIFLIEPTPIKEMQGYTSVLSKGELLLQNLTHEAVAEFLHTTSRKHSMLTIEGYDIEGDLNSNHSGQTWIKAYTNIAFPIGSIVKVVFPHPRHGAFFEVLGSIKDGKTYIGTDGGDDFEIDTYNIRLVKGKAE